jgi:hypothetical protein
VKGHACSKYEVVTLLPMASLVCDFSCTEQTVSLFEETFLPEKL